MKRYQLLSVILVAMMLIPFTANAGFRIGPRVGANVNTLRFNSDVFSKENRVGFTAGMEGELMFGPLGLDASVLYVRRTQEAAADRYEPINSTKDYISVPVNFKFKLSLPAIGAVVAPYVLTGPEFAFLTSKKAINEAWSNKSVDVAWNFGAGLELFRHLQVSATYGIGMTKLSNDLGLTTSSPSGQILKAHNNQWTITAAWLF